MQEAAKHTGFTAETLLDALTAAHGQLESTNLNNAAIKQWGLVQPDGRPRNAPSLRVRVLTSGLHVIRRWRAGVPGFNPRDRPVLIAALIADAWRFKGKPCADCGAYAEMRRILPRPFACEYGRDTAA